MANPLTTALQIGIEEGRKQEQIANKPRDTGNPLNDMTGIGGGKPLPKPTPPPKEIQLPIPGVDWRKFLVDLMINPEIAGGPYRDNKEGNVDEVWDLTGPKFIGPMPKSFYDAVDKIRMSLPVKKAQISPTDTPRDLKIQDVIQKYGKDEKGKYKNPELLIKNLPRA